MAEQGSSSSTHFAKLQVFRHHAPVTVLGPGKRAAIWVQGCNLRCRNCVVPESWDPNCGYEISTSELAEWVLSHDDLQGITLSGGEPMQQPAALHLLLDLILQERDFDVVCYTGFRYEFLKHQGNADQKKLLAYVDLLIDGPYIERLHRPLLWRGSSNQRLIPLAKKYRTLVDSITDLPSGLEVFLDFDGAFEIIGIPPFPNFRHQLDTLLLSKGVRIAVQPSRP